MENTQPDLKECKSRNKYQYWAKVRGFFFRFFEVFGTPSKQLVCHFDSHTWNRRHDSEFIPKCDFERI